MKHLSLVLLLVLTACGFRPIYANYNDRAPVAEAMNRIEIANLENRTGQMMRNHLIDRLYVKGKPTETRTRLEIQLKATETDLGQQRDATSSRQQYDLTASFVLKDKKDIVLTSGYARSTVTFAKLTAQYGTLAIRRNAEERALNEAAEQIVNALSLYFAEGGKEEGVAPTKPAP